MNFRYLIVALAITIVSSTAYGSEKVRLSKGDQLIYGGNPAFSKAPGDTILLMGREGSGAPYAGDFESGWNGWTPVDNTQTTITHWQVSNYNQSEPTNLAAWCGDITLATCSDSLDVVGGYGNSWHDLLSYRVVVANPSIEAVVHLTATLQHDTEPGYDFVRLSMKIEGTSVYTDIRSWDNAGLVNVDEAFTYDAAEYVNGTDVFILWRVQSDGGWSDADCMWPTAGACQIDDIEVTVYQAGELDLVNITDFQDGTFGGWLNDFVPGVGNFGKLWRNLQDIDPCSTNYSQQVAFIDDGLVVPGTGGTQCIDWCYGPSGYVNNWTGGIGRIGHWLDSAAYSPIMSWPDSDHSGLEFAFDVYVHEELDETSTGVFYQWSVRSADTDGSHGPVQNIDDMPFEDRNFIYWGGPEYRRVINNVSDLLTPGRDEVQIQVSAYKSAWLFWGWPGNSGTPAPYFDNFSVKSYQPSGPSMVASEDRLAQDNFPESDTINYSDLGSMHVRFDMAANISPGSHLRYDPGDSIVITIVPGRDGAELVQTDMHYTIDTNPLFDAFRTTATTGIVNGTPAIADGIPSATEWQFDLPDSATLFPGDVLHYYFRATDDLLGDVQSAIMPVDLTGYGNFTNGSLAYDTRFEVRALPTITDDGNGGFASPDILFWDDQVDSGSDAAWHSSLQQLGYVAGVDFDIYRTATAESGIGSRTTGPALEPYDDLLYTSGTVDGSSIVSQASWESEGDDIAALMHWLAQGNKDAFFTGDNIAADLSEGIGTQGLDFANDVLGIDLVATDLKELIDNQMSPLVLPISGNSVISNVDRWIAYGGCAAINSFDAVTLRAGATRLAEFTNPSGSSGQYAFAAMVENVYDTTNRIIFQPYDLRFITIDPAATQTGPFPGRVQVLSDILEYFGASGLSTPSLVAPVARFTTSNYPNPFNPSTEISYTIKAPGHLILKVYNTRGELVKTLVDENVDHDNSVQWRGDNNQGERVSSGVYFYEARMGKQVQINKMALIK